MEQVDFGSMLGDGSYQLKWREWEWKLTPPVVKALKGSLTNHLLFIAQGIELGPCLKGKTDISYRGFGRFRLNKRGRKVVVQLVEPEPEDPPDHFFPPGFGAYHPGSKC